MANGNGKIKKGSSVWYVRLTDLGAGNLNEAKKVLGKGRYELETLKTLRRLVARGIPISQSMIVAETSAPNPLSAILSLTALVAHGLIALQPIAEAPPEVMANYEAMTARPEAEAVEAEA